MPYLKAASFLLFALSSFLTALSASVDWVTFQSDPSAFRLVHKGKSSEILVSDDDFTVVKIAAQDLVEDIERVTGVVPNLKTAKAANLAGKVVVGTVGHSSLVSSLVLDRGLDVSELNGKWESFQISVVGEGSEATLAIVGSDRRGTAYGVYELSQAIGVSPWYWWADTPAKKSDSLFVKSGTRQFGPPSVKYRGIFINDEDWGLFPWAAQTFDPETGDIGPKTYEKIFELLLRLKANTLWPAMHEVTAAFNTFPKNKEIADDYAIVMSSSHAEPMLRNNVGEWKTEKSGYNYQTNSEEVYRYWEERVKENGGYENVYTLGMRGIHDSGMSGGSSIEEKIALIEKIFSDQRELLQKHVDEDLANVQQVFTPYKEVLELYKNGLQVPEDVTIVWPDDNFGFLRRFPNEGERARDGGSGVYYHLSYLGAPLSYLWLDTTPLALVWEEMHRSYQLGSQDYWIANVGDLKPQERSMEFFLSMAWDIDRWGPDAQAEFLKDWAGREFGEGEAEAIADLMNEYYRLNSQRRPEHLQWWMPYKRVQTSPLTEEELADRMTAFMDLIEDCERIESKLAESQYDSFFQLVAYPVKASAYYNLQYFHLEQYFKTFQVKNELGRVHGGIGAEAGRLLASLTAEYNNDIADGKWKGIIAVEPADSAWRSYRTTPWIVPAEGLIDKVDDIAAAHKGLEYRGAKPVESTQPELTIEAENFDRRGGATAAWETIPNLGWSGDAITVLPVTEASRSVEEIDEDTPWVEYDVKVANSGTYRLFLDFLPTFPSSSTGELSVAVSIDGGEPQLISIYRKSKSAEWAQGVLSGLVGAEISADLKEGESHSIRISMLDTGVVLDRLSLHQGELQSCFSGPSAL
ncbi:glycosyl hydrolase 115 family protein [Pelagicoccus albus]|uniref:Glycosyl hydrolase 115 family protein n=1 Tax=Pelagicoccus albus TaxID=415222 RepID=A0A7X1B4G1_9BACT|nr:glycosyl hydrolase 115 family protein [Pelagicoccus albus]MBC2605468.1 glycosyl hydrolase 115 family protein [Pelagicoccus albus]